MSFTLCVGVNLKTTPRTTPRTTNKRFSGPFVLFSMSKRKHLKEFIIILSRENDDDGNKLHFKYDMPPKLSFL